MIKHDSGIFLANKLLNVKNLRATDYVAIEKHINHVERNYI